MRVSIACIALAVLTACAGTNFRWEDTAKVQNGMTEAEVIEILGPPYQRVQASGGMTILTWSHANALGGAKAISYRLVNDKVVGSTAVNSR